MGIKCSKPEEIKQEIVSEIKPEIDEPPVVVKKRASFTLSQKESVLEMVKFFEFLIEQDQIVQIKKKKLTFKEIRGVKHKITDELIYCKKIHDNYLSEISVLNPDEDNDESNEEENLIIRKRESNHLNLLNKYDLIQNPDEKELNIGVQALENLFIEVLKFYVDKLFRKSNMRPIINYFTKKEKYKLQHLKNLSVNTIKSPYNRGKSGEIFTGSEFHKSPSKMIDGFLAVEKPGDSIFEREGSRANSVSRDENEDKTIFIVPAEKEDDYKEMDYIYKSTQFNNDKNELQNKILEIFKCIFDYKSKNQNQNIQSIFNKLKKCKNRFKAFDENFADLINLFIHLFSLSYTNSLVNTPDTSFYYSFDREKINTESKLRYLGEDIINEDYNEVLRSLSELIIIHPEEEAVDTVSNLTTIPNVPAPIEQTKSDNMINSKKVLDRLSKFPFMNQTPALKTIATKESFATSKNSFDDYTLDDNKRAASVHNKKMSKPVKNKVKFDHKSKAFEFYMGEYDIVNYNYEGHGVMFNKSASSIYNGTFKMNQRWGIGTFFEKKAEKYFYYYRGQWKNNKINGFGVSYIVDKSDNECKKRYLQEGIFCNGIFQRGFQLTIHSDHIKKQMTIYKYYGSIEDEKYVGKGHLIKQKFKKSEIDKKYEERLFIEYKGEFLDNKYHGKGDFTKKDMLAKYEEHYIGNFVKGKKCDDDGLITFNDGFYIKSYQGGFENDTYFCNYGKVEFASGDCYEGFFDEDHGKSKVGLYYHKDKITGKKENNFFGEFFHDRKHGLGRFIFKEGSMSVGNYVDGERNGNFELITHVIETLNRTGEFKPKGTTGLVKKKNMEISQPEKRVRKKMYYLFENDEPIDTSDKPITY